MGQCELVRRRGDVNVKEPVENAWRGRVLGRTVGQCVNWCEKAGNVKTPVTWWEGVLEGSWRPGEKVWTMVRRWAIRQLSVTTKFFWRTSWPLALTPSFTGRHSTHCSNGLACSSFTSLGSDKTLTTRHKTNQPLLLTYRSHELEHPRWESTKGTPCPSQAANKQKVKRKKIVPNWLSTCCPSGDRIFEPLDERDAGTVTWGLKLVPTNLTRGKGRLPVEVVEWYCLLIGRCAGC